MGRGGLPHRRVFAAAAASILALCGAAPAKAEIKFGGRTSQGRGVTVRSDGGLISRLTIRWRAPCTPRGYFRGRTVFRPPYDSRSSTRLTDEGTYRSRYRRERYRIHTRVVGHARSARKWRGTLRSTVVARRGGHVIARCASGRVRWRAGYHAAALVLNSEHPYEILGHGRSYSYATPRYSIVRVGSNRRSATIEMADWMVIFEAPGRHRLHERLYRHVKLADENGRRPGLMVTGNATACRRVSGSFRIRRLRFDRHGLRVLIATFTHYCEHQPYALRGQVTYRR